MPFVEDLTSLMLPAKVNLLGFNDFIRDKDSEEEF